MSVKNVKRLLLIIVLNIIGLSVVLAQNNYYDRDGKPALMHDCYYYSVSKSKYSEGDTLKEYYCRTNSLKSVTVVDERGVPNGSFLEYYENGNLKTKGRYEKARTVGTTSRWYSNGQMQIEFEGAKYNDVEKILNYWDSTGTYLVKDGNGYCKCHLNPFSKFDLEEHGKVVSGRRDSTWTGFKKGMKYYIESYSEGNLMQGTSYDSIGNSYAYTEPFTPARPHNGLEAFYRQVSKNVKYPAAARKNGIQGKVYVEFVVEKDGSLSGLKAIKGIGGGCDEAAIDAIRFAGKWDPAVHRGQLVRNKMVLPIGFHL